MKKTLFIVIVCVAVCSVLLGTTAISFASIKHSAEGIKESSSDLLGDISAMTLFAFTVSDFFQGADYWEVELAVYQNEQNQLTGESKIIYRVYREVPLGTSGGTGFELMRSEELPLSSKGSDWSLSDAQIAYDRITYPIKPFIEWEKVEYDGLFSVVIEVFQFIAYILGMIWGALSLVMLILLDTITTAWELIRLGFTAIGFD